jgi:hypothetical protein
VQSTNPPGGNNFIAVAAIQLKKGIDSFVNIATEHGNIKRGEKVTYKASCLAF